MDRAFISNSQISIWKWDLNLSLKEFEIQPLCVRSPWSKGTQSNQSPHSPIVEKREQEEKTIKSHSKSKALLTFFCRLWAVLSPLAGLPVCLQVPFLNGGDSIFETLFATAYTSLCDIELMYQIEIQMKQKVSQK